MDGVPIHNLEEEDYHLVRGCDDSDSENDFIYNKRMPQALLKEVRDLPGEDVHTDFPRDQGQIPSVDVNDRTRVNGTFKHLLRWLLIFLCLWAPFSSLSDNALEIACSGNYEEFGYKFSSSGLLGSFGWTRVNLQIDGGKRRCKTNCFNGRRYSWSETTQRKRRGVYCPSAKTMAVMQGSEN